MGAANGAGASRDGTGELCQALDKVVLERARWRRARDAADERRD